MTRRVPLAPADLVGPLLLIGVAVAQLWPAIAAGLAAPISWDHGAHLGKAMLTAQELLPNVRGWTDLVEAGVPLNTLYSVGGPLWVLLWRIPTLGLEWSQTYCVAFTAFRVLVGLAPYRLARAAGASRTGAFFAGLLALTDHGDHSEGGWFYDVTYGVWPMSLAMCFLFLGLAELLDGDARRGTRGALARAALLFGAALVTHQMPLVGLATLLPLLWLGRWLDGAGDAAALGVRAAVAACLGALLAGFWLVPMLAQAAFVADHGQLYRSFVELGEGVATGQMVLRAGPFTAVLVAVGMLRGLIATGRRRLLAVAALAMIVLSSRTWLAETDALRVLPALGKIMYPRFLMLAKPMEMVLAGWLVGDVLEAGARELRARLRGLRGALALALVVLLLAPFGRGLWRGFVTVALERPLETTATSPLWPHFLAYAAWHAERREPFHRAAYRHDASHLFQGAPAFTGVPAHKVGMLIAETFSNTVPSGRASVLAEMNVRYLVTTGGRIDGSGAEPVARFGPIAVFEHQGFRSEPASVLPRGAARAGAEGGEPDRRGAVQVVSLARDRVTLRAEGPGTLVLRRAYAPGWKARVDGRSAAVSRHPVPESFGLEFSAVALGPGPHEVVFAYDAWRAPDVTGLLATALGALLLLTLVASPRPLAGLDRIAGRLRTLGFRLSPRAVALSVLAALALGAGAYATRRGRRLSDHLREARYELVDARGIRTACDARHESGGWQCPSAEWLWVGPTIQPVAGKLRSCTWMHPPGPGSEGVLTFPRVALGRRLRLGAGVSDEAYTEGQDGPPVTLEVRVDGVSIGAIEAAWSPSWSEVELPTPEGTHEVTLIVRAARDSRRFFCFDAEPR